MPWAELRISLRVCSHPRLGCPGAGMSWGWDVSAWGWTWLKRKVSGRPGAFPMAAGGTSRPIRPCVPVEGLSGAWSEHHKLFGLKPHPQLGWMQLLHAKIWGHPEGIQCNPLKPPLEGKGWRQKGSVWRHLCFPLPCLIHSLLCSQQQPRGTCWI